jgi:hypothetical protein
MLTAQQNRTEQRETHDELGRDRFHCSSLITSSTKCQAAGKSFELPSLMGFRNLKVGRASSSGSGSSKRQGFSIPFASHIRLGLLLLADYKTQ